MTEPAPDITPALLHELTAAMVADSLDAAGCRDQVMDARLGPLAAGSRIIGRAATVQFVPVYKEPDDPYGAAIDFIDGLRAGSVAVVATEFDDRTAYWGELFAAAAMGRGAVGAVCDGPVRDTAKIRALGFPVFTPASRPVDFRARMRVAGTDLPVHCAGVVVDPGDLVVADDDGIVVIPTAVEAEVFQLAVKRLSAETSVLGELLDGAGLRAVWNKWGVL